MPHPVSCHDELPSGTQSALSAGQSIGERVRRTSLVSRACCLQGDTAITISADIPGVKREDIKVEIDDHILSISVSRDDEKEGTREEEDGTKWHHTERSHAFVKRSVRLPDTADTESVSAEYKDGVLSVSVQKQEVPDTTKRITVK